jgi:hypothetical protein
MALVRSHFKAFAQAISPGNYSFQSYLTFLSPGIPITPKLTDPCTVVVSFVASTVAYECLELERHDLFYSLLDPLPSTVDIPCFYDPDPPRKKRKHIVKMTVPS